VCHCEGERLQFARDSEGLCAAFALASCDARSPQGPDVAKRIVLVVITVVAYVGPIDYCRLARI
jgi:hypothetical protein